MDIIDLLVQGGFQGQIAWKIPVYVAAALVGAVSASYLGFNPWKILGAMTVMAAALGVFLEVGFLFFQRGALDPCPEAPPIQHGLTFTEAKALAKRHSEALQKCRAQMEAKMALDASRFVAEWLASLVSALVGAAAGALIRRSRR